MNSVVLSVNVQYNMSKMIQNTQAKSFESNTYRYCTLVLIL